MLLCSPPVPTFKIPSSASSPSPSTLTGSPGSPSSALSSPDVTILPNGGNSPYLNLIVVVEVVVLIVELLLLVRTLLVIVRAFFVHKNYGLNFAIPLPVPRMKEGAT